MRSKLLRKPERIGVPLRRSAAAHDMKDVAETALPDPKKHSYTLSPPLKLSAIGTQRATLPN